MNLEHMIALQTRLAHEVERFVKDRSEIRKVWIAQIETALRQLLDGPLPTQTINAGVVNRLMREDLARIVMLPSPYKTHKGKRLAHLEITDAGRTRQLVTEDNSNE